MDHPQKSQEIVDTFNLLEEAEVWEYLLELGSLLPDSSDSIKIPANKVEGCSSRVWVSYNKAKGWQMTSDSKLIMGVLYLIYVDLMSGSKDFKLLKQVQITNYLSVTRRNGLERILDKVREIQQNENH